MRDEQVGERVARLEGKVDSMCNSIESLDRKMESLMSNHIPHLRRDLASTKVEILTEMADTDKRLSVQTSTLAVKVALVMGAVTTLVTAVINYFF